MTNPRNAKAAFDVRLSVNNYLRSTGGASIQVQRRQGKGDETATRAQASASYGQRACAHIPSAAALYGSIGRVLDALSARGEGADRCVGRVQREEQRRPVGRVVGHEATGVEQQVHSVGSTKGASREKVLQNISPRQPVSRVHTVRNHVETCRRVQWKTHAQSRDRRVERVAKQKIKCSICERMRSVCERLGQKSTDKRYEAFAMWTGRALFYYSKRSLCGHLSINLPSGQEILRGKGVAASAAEKQAFKHGGPNSNFENASLLPGFATRLPCVSNHDDEIQCGADFLVQLLSSIPVSVEEIRSESKRAGYTWATIRRAKDEIGVRSKKGGFGKTGEWFWYLPKVLTRADKEVSTLRESEHLSGFQTTKVLKGAHEDSELSTLGENQSDRGFDGCPAPLDAQRAHGEEVEHLSREHLRDCTAREYRAARDGDA